MTAIVFPETYAEYHLLLATLAWVLAFGVALRRGWSWTRGLGLALLLHPFLRLAVGVWLTIGLVFRGDYVADPLTLWEIWEKVLTHAVTYGVVPFAGALLLYRRRGTLVLATTAAALVAVAWPTAVAAGLVAGLRGLPLTAAGVAGAALGVFAAWKAHEHAEPPIPDLAADTGMRPRRRAGEDALAGAALFFGVAAAYVVALGLVTSALGDVVNTGDDTRVFDNITPLTVLLLSVVAGVTEEFLFRGVLQTWLTRLLGRAAPAAVAVGAAVVLQAAFFGLVHSGYGNLAHVIGPFLFGLGMGVVARQLGILAAVVLHVEVDVLALGLTSVTVPVVVLFGLLVTANVYALLVLRGRPMRWLFARPT